MIKEIKNLYLDEKFTIKETAEELGLSFWKVYGSMKKNNIRRRGPSEADYLQYDKSKPRFEIKDNIGLKDEKLKVAGIMLYWAEGAQKGYTVDFANSDSEMIKVFLRFLREICGIAEKRLRIYLYAFSDQNIAELKKHWSDITKVPLAQFTKPYVKKANLDLKHRKMPYGLIHVRYNDKRLLERIRYWISEYIGSLN